jgi:hypothetical protein
MGDCGGRECGSDGCGNPCGTNGGACAGGQACDANGQCVCQPDCVGKACGDDGCGGECGECAGGLSCTTLGQCGCTADCTGRECGGDGCGGTCGASAGSCPDGLSCSAGSCVEQCVPSCTGKRCGDDGCGGTCGSCGVGEACAAGACEASTVTFDDVFAIFQVKDCARAGCHGGARPAEMLDLSTAAVAQSELIDVTSRQCARQLVEPGDAAASYLVNKLTGTSLCSGSQMPKGGSPLNNTQLDTVRAWIDGL